MTDNAAHVLSQLEVGFRTDSAQLRELENTLDTTVHSARLFGSHHGSAGEQEARWHRQWDQAGGILLRLRRLVAQIEASIDSPDDDRHETALRLWALAQDEDGRLLEALKQIRTQAGELDVAARKQWNLLARQLENQLETIHSCGQALRVKLELLKRHSRPEVDQLIHNALAKSVAGPAEGAQFDHDYRAAVLELGREQHAFSGFWDVVKGLSLWVETPDERMQKRRSLTLNCVRTVPLYPPEWRPMASPGCRILAKHSSMKSGPW